MDPAKNMIGDYDDEVGNEVRKAKQKGIAKSSDDIVKNIVG